MGIGLLYLIAKGREDLYMVQDPNITFFKIVYKKHTNFSTESINQYFKTIPDFGRKVTSVISKNADLMGDIYLKVTLPSISNNNHPEIPDIKKFKWSKKIGLALIKSIEIIIGGVVISTLYNDWINIWFELTKESSQNRGYNKMIGNIEELYEYSNGKSSYTLTIPLNFWFTRESGLFIPLISIYHHDIMIDVEFNDFDNVFNETPTHYITIDDNYVLFDKNEHIIQNVNNNINIGEFIYYDSLTKKLYFNKIKGNFSMNSKYKIYGLNSKFEIIPKNNYLIVKDNDYFDNVYPSIINANLMINYIYLDNTERGFFRENDHQYLIELPTKNSSRIINNNITNYKINFKNPSKLIIFYGKLLSNIGINDHFNYSINPVITNKEFNNIIKKTNLVINSINRVELDDFSYYCLIEKFKSGFQNYVDNIGLFSFSLHPLEYQPSGSLNFSKVDDSYLLMTLDPTISYNNPVEATCFSLEYNIFRVINGLAGLAFYN